MAVPNGSRLGGRFLLAGVAGLLLTGAAYGQPAETFLEARFAVDADGFSYADDAFRGTSEPNYAAGARLPSGGLSGGALRVTLGGADSAAVRDMSGAWRRTFTLSEATPVSLSFSYNLTQAAHYESDELSQVLVSVDGILYGQGANDYVARVVGDGNGGSPRTTGWRLFRVDLGTLPAGDHTLAVGAYNNKKTWVDETTEVLIDDVRVTSEPAADPNSGARALVDGLDFERFKTNISILSGFGDRSQFGAGSQSYTNAEQWIVEQLAAAGYTIEEHAYTYQGHPRRSVYVTKVGTAFPDRMYIVSAHLDGRGGGGAADDDGSGVSLVLESALALAPSRVEPDISIRFVFWNNEETGLNGSTAYVNDRALLQGREDPPGSGIYPEPTWLGIIQHDMILFDHGLPPAPDQIPEADIDIEYQAASTFASEASRLADALYVGNGRYSTDYPAEVGSNMRFTDSWPFRNFTASVSVRENPRVAEIGNGANPHWHQWTDRFETYSEADFRLGFNALQMTLGTVAELAGVRVVPANTPPAARDDAYTVDQDTTLTVALPGVLGNDSDADGDALTAVLVAGPTKGTVTLDADGSFTYAPNAGVVGTDAFTYTATDGPAHSAVATVTITVAPAPIPTNTPPAARGDAYTVAEDGPLSVDLPGVLGNDSDGDGDALTAAVVTGPTNGTLTLAADGSFTYAPSANFSGTDTFTYAANDGAATSNAATVTITVTPTNDSPAAGNDAYSLQADTVLDVGAPGVLGNDSDVDGDALTAVLVEGPTDGVVTLAPDGALTYVPNAGFAGLDRLTYAATDGTAASEPATATITVTPAAPSPILAADFDADDGGFSYVDDAFRGTSQSRYARGARLASGGFSGGALRVTLGGIDNADIRGMSGGWRQGFTLSAPTRVVLSFRYRLTQASNYEADELSEVLVSLDGALSGQAARIVGNGNGGSPRTTGWQLFQLDVGTLAAGQHTLTIGGYNNQKTYSDETTEVLIDDVLVVTGPAG